MRQMIMCQESTGFQARRNINTNGEIMLGCVHPTPTQQSACGKSVVDETKPLCQNPNKLPATFMKFVVIRSQFAGYE